MKQSKVALKVLLAFLLSAISITYFVDLLKSDEQSEPEVKQSVTISASVNINRIRFTVYPEKRIPPTGNWSVETSLQIRPTGTTTPSLERTGIVTDNSGNGEIILGSDFLSPSVYDFSFKGISHLRKNYESYAVTSVDPYFDFSATGEDLLAGDTSVVVDNYVNSLDVSTVAKNFYGTNLQDDLNRDGQVNSLDLSNQIINLYKFGDT